MKGKLIKTGEGLYNLLYVTNNTVAEHNEAFDGKLSIPNCQAIERGYDLDELAFLSVEHIVNRYGERNTSRVSELDQERGFKRGFQKALEILGDKKFSEEDLDKGFDLGKYVEREDCTGNYLAYKHSLQQTEWDVEIKMKCMTSASFMIIDFSKDPIQTTGEKDLGCFEETPELDADGCLILKRII